ncbi:glucan endo-1,3-beta-glucosidase-like [Zingiber officinale]|nr:glucan endo-1,3-beta-glucosidase-like [Zingiber officinale]
MDGDAQYVLPAMRNLHHALESAGLDDRLTVDTGVLGSTFLPSNDAFSADTSSPFLVSFYTYPLHSGNNSMVSLSYALMNHPAVWIDDTFAYTYPFNSLVDPFYAALKREGAPQVPVVVAETGWPSQGVAGPSTENTQTYNQNPIRRIGKGTPARSGEIEVYIYGMFHEDQKSHESKAKFGLFSPDMQSVYPLGFSWKHST